ncbi:MAG: hypothetical protein HYY96_13710 [Candidatus Tectomicrobia bacterium]|nr:hypothetical protein [Candidatus Tectomicrobia bacterium]
MGARVRRFLQPLRPPSPGVAAGARGPDSLPRPRAAQTLLLAAQKNAFENASPLEAPGLKTLLITLAQMGLTKYSASR